MYMKTWKTQFPFVTEFLISAESAQFFNTTLDGDQRPTQSTFIIKV